MTVHIISVGVSLRDALAEPRRSLAKWPELAREIQDSAPHKLLEQQGIRDGEAASSWLTRTLAASGPPPNDNSASQLTNLITRVQADQWPDSISAELDTFTRVPGAGRPMRRKDIAVLVSSDTADGLLSGLWNCVALVGGDLSRVRYLATADEQPGDVRGRVVLVRVEGLDAGHEQGFREAMRGLGMLGRQLFATTGISPQEEPISLYLSGGFKAAIPYLIGMAEGLRSLYPERDIAAYVLHETTNSDAIRLPLRYLMAEWVRKELEGFGDGTRRTAPADPRLLEGYAYERESKGWRMTAFGEGLHTLFGLSAEGLGG